MKSDDIVSLLTPNGYGILHWIVCVFIAAGLWLVSCRIWGKVIK